MSLANFVTIVVMARAVAPESFGDFALGLALVTLIMSLGTAALTQPFVVLSARFDPPTYRRFLASTIFMQLLFAASISLPVLAVAAIAGLLHWHYALLILMVIPAMSAWLVQEFVRQAFYAEGRLVHAFGNDLISYGGQGVGFVTAALAGALNPISGLGILAFTSLLAILEGLWLLRRSIDWSFSREELSGFLSEVWAFGRWTSGSAAVVAVSGFFTSLLLATFSGPAAVGVFRAFITTTSPIRVLVEGAKNSFVPGAAQIFEKEGIASLKVYVRKVFLLFAPLVAAYCLVAAGLASPILDVLFAGKFQDYAWLLPFMIGAYFLDEIFFAVEIGLRAQRITDVIFRGTVVEALGALVLGPPLIYFFGLTGMVSLVVLLAPVAGVMMWMRYQGEAGDRTREPRYEGHLEAEA